MDSLATIIKELFADPSPKKWRTALFFGVVVMVGAFLAEVSTGFRFLWAMDKKVELLKELNDLAVTGVDKNPQLASIYNDLSNKLNEYNVEPLTVALITTDDTLATTIKILAAIWLWLIVFLALFLKWYKGEGSRGIFLAASFMLALSAGLAYWLPSVGTFWINAAVYILVNIGIIKVVNTYGENTKKAKVQSVPVSQASAQTSAKGRRK